MAATLSALIAVIGTLLGSLVTYRLQRQTLERSERFARSERLRQERAATYTAFSQDVMAYRQAQFRRWDQARLDRSGRAYEDAKATSYELRSVCWQALYRVQLLADDLELVRQADAVIDLVVVLHHATDKDNLRAQGAEIRQTIEKFMATASGQVL